MSDLEELLRDTVRYIDDGTTTPGMMARLAIRIKAAMVEPAQYSDVVSNGGMDPRNEPAPAQDEREAVVVVGYAYNLESGAYSQYPGADWSALMTVAQHERIVAALTRPATAPSNE